MRDHKYRSAVGVALAAALILVTVGVLGGEGDPEVMSLWVLPVGIIGANIARFQPHGMARALFATALAQMLVPVIALIAGMHRSPDQLQHIRDLGYLDPEWVLRLAVCRIGLAVSKCCAGATSRGRRAGGCGLNCE